MEIASTILNPIVTELIREIFRVFRRRGVDKSQDIHVVQRRLSQHLTEVVNWAGEVQFYGMAYGEDTQTQTIPLIIDTLPRKFRGDRGDTRKISEGHLLSDHANYLVLGDPGSGKTTTLKRLANSIIRNQEDDKDWQYPIVIRLRSIDTEISMSASIASVLGIDYSSRKDASLAEDTAERQAAHRAIIEDIKSGNDRGAQLHVEDVPLDKVICETLDNTGAILFIDGLDEVSEQDRLQIETSIASLALGMVSCKIILSCRSGDYVRNIKNFQIVEMCPLDRDQIDAISRRWLADPEAFLSLVASRPFSDLSNRPLLLCHLIVFYRNAGYLPEKPASIYNKLARLLLEDWDRRRGIKRASRYSSFNMDEKLEFLSALSYQLTYRIRTKRFNREILERCYRIICRQFGLPEQESHLVVSEIETHAGILVESGIEHFEFSHLSLQEFFCANHIVRDPTSGHLVDYMREYPSPVAVAVSLASNPSNWIANIFLKHEKPLGVNERSIGIFLSRLEQEKPRFPESIHFGLSILKILFLFERDVYEALWRLLDRPGAVESFALALESFQVAENRTSRDRLWLMKKGHLKLDPDFYPPETGPLSMPFLSELRGSIRVRTEPSKVAGTSNIVVEVVPGRN